MNHPVGVVEMKGTADKRDKCWCNWITVLDVTGAVSNIQTQNVTDIAKSNHYQRWPEISICLTLLVLSPQCHHPGTWWISVNAELRFISEESNTCLGGDVMGFCNAWYTIWWSSLSIIWHDITIRQPDSNVLKSW